MMDIKGYILNVSANMSDEDKFKFYVDLINWCHHKASVLHEKANTEYAEIISEVSNDDEIPSRQDTTEE